MTSSSRTNDQPSMSWASSRGELPEQSTTFRGRPASAAPVVTQLVTQHKSQTLKRNLDGLSADLRWAGRHAGHARSWAHAARTRRHG